jgi:magnesium-protoporphyrin IX monomethyl ester (oxidative) cyclase
VLLVQMPYGNLEKPSMALGLLKAILAAGGISVEVDYCNLEFARQIGIGRYHALSKLYVE